MRGGSIILGLMALIIGILLCRQFLPEPMIAFNPDNLILQQETAIRPPPGVILK